MDPRDPAEGRAAGHTARAVATMLGVGRAPLASGTVGSLVVMPVCWLLAALGGWPALAGASVVVTAVGIWSAGRVVRETGDPDPSEVVVDEAAGQMLALVGLAPTWPVLAVGFLLFRGLDIIKPPPIRQLERLPGGWGVMADDVAAGVGANLLLQLAVRWFPGLFG